MAATVRRTHPTATTDPGVVRPPPNDATPAPWLLDAWLAVLAIPMFFMGALAFGEGLYSMLGDVPGVDILPLAWDLLLSVFSLIAFLLPCLAAIAFAARAIRDGHGWGRVPLAIGMVIAAYLTAMTVAWLIATGFG